MLQNIITLQTILQHFLRNANTVIGKWKSDISSEPKWETVRINHISNLKNFVIVAITKKINKAKTKNDATWK